MKGKKIETNAGAAGCRSRLRARLPRRIAERRKPSSVNFPKQEPHTKEPGRTNTSTSLPTSPAPRGGTPKTRSQPSGWAGGRPPSPASSPGSAPTRGHPTSGQRRRDRPRPPVPSGRAPEPPGPLAPDRPQPRGGCAGSGAPRPYLPLPCLRLLRPRDPHGPRGSAALPPPAGGAVNGAGRGGGAAVGVARC